MASYTITIPNENLNRIIDGICYQQGYQDNIPDPQDREQTIPNPETKIQFAKRMNRQWIRENVKAWETNLASGTARDSASSDADTVTDGIAVS